MHHYRGPAGTFSFSNFSAIKEILDGAIIRGKKELEERPTAPRYPEITLELPPPPYLRLMESFARKSARAVPITAIPANTPESVWNRLLPYQRRGVHEIVLRKGRILLADDQGLGKTVQACVGAAVYRSEWPLVIVCPAGMRLVWRDELLKWVAHSSSSDPQGLDLSDCGEEGNYEDGLSDNDILVVSKATDIEKFSISSHRVLICSYSLATVLGNRLKVGKVLILDESHALQDINSGRTKTIVSISTNFRRIMLLSGTPALARPIELYAQLYILSPRVFQDVALFGRRFCNCTVKKTGSASRSVKKADMRGASNLEELSALLQCLMVRRLKSEVLNDLPPKQHVVQRLEVGGQSLAAAKAALLALKTIRQNKRNENQYRAAVGTAYQRTAEAKTAQVVQWIASNIGSEPTIIFGHHATMLSAIMVGLRAQRLSYVSIDGSTTPRNRHRAVQRFQEGDVDVAVLSLKAANSGITLHRASCVVFAELFWSGAELQQAEDRAHRVGATYELLKVFYLCAPGTFDDEMLSLVIKKDEVRNELYGAQETFTDS